MVLINERVQNILNLIEKFKAVEMLHVYKLYYNYNGGNFNAQKKLTAMVKENLIKRKRNNFNARYYYYMEKEPAQVQHKLSLVELYVSLCERFGISNVYMMPEYSQLEGIRPDAYVEIIRDNRKYLYFVEVQLCNMPVDIQKYELIYKNKPFGNTFPAVLVIGKSCSHDYIKVINIKDYDVSVL